MKDLWKFIQAEALDELDSREGRLIKVVLLGEIQEPGGAKTFRITSNNENRELRRHEVAGLLATNLSDILNP